MSRPTVFGRRNCWRGFYMAVTGQARQCPSRKGAITRPVIVSNVEVTTAQIRAGCVGEALR